MNTLIQKLLMIILFLSFSIKAETDISLYCPVLDLNKTTRHYFEKAIDRLLSEPEYEAELANLGIFKPAFLSEFRILTTVNDSAVCQKLNERFNNLDSAQVYDHELDRYMPSIFMVYYEVQDRYIAFMQYYDSGSDVEGMIGPPGTGWRYASVYDKKNLNYLGRIGF